MWDPETMKNRPTPLEVEQKARARLKDDVMDMLIEHDIRFMHRDSLENLIKLLPKHVQEKFLSSSD